MNHGKLYTIAFGRTIIKTKKRLSLFLHGKKQPVNMYLYVGDLLWQYDGQPTVSQYYLAARYLDAKLVKEGIFDKSYCEELSRAFRGTANSKEKTIETMKKYKVFLDDLEEKGFNPSVGNFSIANDPSGLFFDDGTHRLAGLLLNKFKYIPARIEDRKTKYFINGKDVLTNSTIDKALLDEIENALKEIRKLFSLDLFVIIRNDVLDTVYETINKYGDLKPTTLSEVSINSKVREEEISPEIWGLYNMYKDKACSLYHYSLQNNALYIKNKRVKSRVIDQIEKEIPIKNWGVIIPSTTQSIEVEMSLSRLDTRNWSNDKEAYTV